MEFKISNFQIHDIHENDHDTQIFYVILEWVSSFWMQMSRVVSWTQEYNNVFVIISCKSPLRFIKITPVVTFTVQKY